MVQIPKLVSRAQHAQEERWVHESRIIARDGYQGVSFCKTLLGMELITQDLYESRLSAHQGALTSEQPYCTITFKADEKPQRPYARTAHTLPAEVVV